MGKQAVILAGGRGTRLGVLTENTPKPLLEVGGQPFVVSLISELARYGFDEFLLLVGPFHDQFQSGLAGKVPQNVTVRLIGEPEPAGTGGALYFVKDKLRHKFLFLNGDSFFDINFLDLIKGTRKGEIARIALRSVPDTARYGAVTVRGCLITSFGEKSATGPGLINGGIYWVDREILEHIPPPPQSLETDILPALVAKGRVSGKVYDANFIDIGTPDDFRRGRAVLNSWRQRPAVFFDRDGVLNLDHGYTHRKDQFDWVPGAKKSIKLFNDLGYLVFVVTNQAGIARGMYQPEDVHALHRWMNGALKRIGAHIDDFYFCPHHPTAGDGQWTQICDCRKPAPGMLEKAFADWPAIRENSFLIGDNQTDVEAANRASIPGYLFEGGDLFEFVSKILPEPQERN